MAELATIARPYAEALFKSSQGDLNGAAQWLDALGAVADNAQLLQFAGNPKVTDQQVFDVVADVAKAQLPGNAKNFLRMVIENGRLAALPEIAAQFRALKNATERLFRRGRVQRLPHRRLDAGRCCRSRWRSVSAAS